MRQVKGIIIILMAALLLFTSAGMAGKNHHSHFICDGDIYMSDEMSIDIEGSSVIIYNEYEDDELEITRDYELYINGDLVKTDKKQQKLLKEFHTTVMDIKDYAIDIGKEGVKIGIEGAKVGLKAVGGVVKMIFTDYDEDDLDFDLDLATDRIEKKAEALEEKAEEIEDMAEDLENLFYDMEEEIPAVAALDW